MKRLLLLLLPVLLTVTACHQVPDHARYIPKNAVAVVGLNLRALGRKVAWSKITGSPLLRELERSLQQQGGASSLGDLQHSGVETNTVLYGFAGADAASGAAPGLTAVLPLDDAATWESYLQKTFPGTAVASGAKGRKEARLGNGLFAAWNAEVAFLRAGDRLPGAFVTGPDSIEVWQDGAPDSARSLAALRGLFDTPKEASVVSDRRFVSLQKEGDDASSWINYDALMSRAGMSGMLSGFGGNLWKSTAAATSINFQKGRVALSMRYYTPEDLKDAYAEMGKGDVSNALLAKAPADGLGLLAAWQLSPKGLRMLLEKMGLLGLANMGLAAQGLSADDVLEGLSGEMLFALNHFRTVVQPADSLRETPPVEPSFDYLAVLGVGKKEKFDKLLGFLTARQLLRQVAPDAYTGLAGPSGVLVVGKDYVAVAPDATAARAALGRTDASQLPVPAREAVRGVPAGVFADLQVLMAGVSPQGFASPESAALFDEAKKRFSQLYFSGGRFRTDHMEAEGALRMVNPDENALVQLLDFAAKAQALRRPAVTASR